MWWIAFIKEIGFPSTMAFILLYALLVRFPETFRQIAESGNERILQTVLQNRGDILRDQQMTQDFQNLALENHKKTQMMLEQVLAELRKR